MARKLKVYRTPIGFHDAYVAAPSQKAALQAWGADADLFSRGVAEAVDDEQLIRAPLEKPGTVVRVLRGSNAEHMAALPEDKPARRRAAAPDEGEGPPPRRARSDARHPARRAAEEKGEEVSESRRPRPKAEAESKPKPKTRQMPRPSRVRLDEAERALERAQTEHEDAVERIRAQEKALQQQRRDLERHHEGEVERLEAAIAKARASYGAAIEKWRA